MRMFLHFTNVKRWNLTKCQVYSRGTSFTMNSTVRFNHCNVFIIFKEEEKHLETLKRPLYRNTSSLSIHVYHTYS